MSKYDAVRNLVDVVGKDDGYFNFSSSESCAIAIGERLGACSRNGEGDFMTRLGESLGISKTQADAIYCGHLHLRHQYVDERDQASIEEHYFRMQDKAFCLNYILSLVESWEAMDTAASNRRAVIDVSSDYFLIDETCDA